MEGASLISEELGAYCGRAVGCWLSWLGAGGDLACVFVQSYGKRAVDFAGVSSRYVHFLES